MLSLTVTTGNITALWCLLRDISVAGNEINNTESSLLPSSLVSVPVCALTAQSHIRLHEDLLRFIPQIVRLSDVPHICEADRQLSQC